MSDRPASTPASRVGVNGAGGRMGAAVAAAVAADPDLELAAVVDPARAGQTVAGLEVGGALRRFADERCDVVVDFTTAEAARVTLPWLAMHGVHAVVGTTGFSDDDLDGFARAFSGPAHCLIAPNFAISAVLMMRFAAIAAPFFETAEIVEYHHDAKVDAPSGTAIATAAGMAAARAAASGSWPADPTLDERLAGARGGEGPAGIRVHAVRMRGMLAHQEVILGGAGQTLTLRQDSYDRTSFMPGVLHACKVIGEYPGLTIGLEAFLGV